MATMHCMQFHDKLAKHCAEKGWKKADLARAVKDVSASTMTNYFEGKTRPDMDTAFRMARALGLSLDFLADDGADDPPAPSLSDDERAVLRVYRALKLDHDRAIEGLSWAAHGGEDTAHGGEDTTDLPMVGRPLNPGPGRRKGTG